MDVRFHFWVYQWKHCPGARMLRLYHPRICAIVSFLYANTSAWRGMVGLSGISLREHLIAIIDYFDCLSSPQWDRFIEQCIMYSFHRHISVQRQNHETYEVWLMVSWKYCPNGTTFASALKILPKNYFFQTSLDLIRSTTWIAELLSNLVLKKFHFGLWNSGWKSREVEVHFQQLDMLFCKVEYRYPFRAIQVAWDSYCPSCHS